MKSLCWLVLMFAVTLDMRSSALAAGQGGVLAKLSAVGSLKEGANFIKRGLLRASAAPDGQSKVAVSSRAVKHKLFAAIAGVGLMWGAYTMPATAGPSCPACGEAPSPEVAKDDPTVRFSHLWHGIGGFPDVDNPNTEFANHYVLVPREGIEYVHFVINKVDATSTLKIGLPWGWKFATDDVDGDGSTNIVASYYNNGWHRIQGWDGVSADSSSMEENIQTTWFNMPGGGTWDGVQFSVQVTGRADYVFEGKSQHQRIEQGNRPLFGGDNDTGDRKITFSVYAQGESSLPQHSLTYRFLGYLPGDAYIDGYFSAIDLEYMGWRVWWNWNHFVEGGKDNYIWDYNEDGSINAQDYFGLQNFLANNNVYGAPPAVLARGGLATSPPPKVNVFAKGDEGTTIRNIKGPESDKPRRNATTTWGELKRQ